MVLVCIEPTHESMGSSAAFLRGLPIGSTRPGLFPSSTALPRRFRPAERRGLRGGGPHLPPQDRGGRAAPPWGRKRCARCRPAPSRQLPVRTRKQHSGRPADSDKTVRFKAKNRPRNSARGRRSECAEEVTVIAIGRGAGAVRMSRISVSLGRVVKESLRVSSGAISGTRRWPTRSRRRKASAGTSPAIRCRFAVS